MRARLLVALPCVVGSLAFGVPAAGAATTSPASGGSPAFCKGSVTLVKDLLNFGKLPKTNAAIAAALTRVDREFAGVAKAAPNATDRKTITTLRTEFARLRTIVVTDPLGTKPADLTFVKGFSKTAAKQGLVLGAEIKAACR